LFTVTFGKSKVGLGVMLGVAVMVGVGVMVGVRVAVSVNVGVFVKVKVAVGVNVFVHKAAVAVLTVEAIVACASGEAPQAESRSTIGSRKSRNCFISNSGRFWEKEVW
jgi:hypothetical protein